MLWQGLSPETLVAVLSCMVWRERSDDTTQPAVSESLQGPISALREAARRVAKVPFRFPFQCHSGPLAACLGPSVVARSTLNAINASILLSSIAGTNLTAVPSVQT